MMVQRSFALVPALVLALCLMGFLSPGQARPPRSDSSYVQELLDILEETNSADSFVLTLNLLLSTEVDAQVAVPFVLRNAERVGILANSVKAGTEDKGKAYAMVAEAVGVLHSRRSAGGKTTGTGSGAPAPVSPVRPWVLEQYTGPDQVKSDSSAPGHPSPRP